MLQPEMPDKMTSVIVPADNASPIFLITFLFILLLPLLRWAIASSFVFSVRFPHVDYLLHSSDHLSVGITNDFREIFPTHYAKMKSIYGLVADLPYNEMA